MPVKSVRLEVAIGAMHLLASGAGSADFATMGLNPEDIDLLHGPKQWQAIDRNKVERLLHVVANGIMDNIGVPRFSLSAEYKAAVISVFVDPCNVMVASEWMGAAATNEALADGVQEMHADKISGGQIYALILELQSSDPGKFFARFEKRIGYEDAKKLKAV